MKAIISNAVFLSLLVACSTQESSPQEAMQKDLAKPIDCSTAAADIKALTGEKARTSREIEYGATSLIPDYAVAPMFTAKGKENFAIEAGEYSQKLDAKIAEIKQQCKIQ